MPAKTKKPTVHANSKVFNRKGNFKFHWWMGAVIVAVIAVIGLVIIRFSNAATTKIWYASDTSQVIVPGVSPPDYSLYRTEPLLPAPNNTVLISSAQAGVFINGQQDNGVRAEVSEFLPAGLGNFTLCAFGKPSPGQGASTIIDVKKFDNSTSSFRTVTAYSTGSSNLNTKLIESDVPNIVGYKQFCATVNRTNIKDGDLLKYSMTLAPSLQESSRFWKLERRLGNMK